VDYNAVFQHDLIEGVPEMTEEQPYEKLIDKVLVDANIYNFRLSSVRNHRRDIIGKMSLEKARPAGKRALPPSVADKDSGEKHAYQYVNAEDVPPIILGTFVGQLDEKRKEVAEALESHKNNSEIKHIIEHIADKVWEKYDQGKNQAADEDECKNFLLMCLDIYEKTRAKKLDRKEKEIDEGSAEL
jgi:hypothetical protein